MAEIDTKKIWARGYYDGLRAAGVSVSHIGEIDMLSSSRAKILLNQQTVAAQKTYEGVPISDAWDISNIVNEVHRLGYGIDYRTIAGCINTLIRAGLVREVSKNKFLRERIKDDAAPVSEIKNVPSLVHPKPTETTEMSTSKPVEKTAIDRLLELSIKATALSKQMQELAAEISDCAVVVETQLNTESTEIKKLRALREVLKDLN